jgi:hypothetical protein
MTVKISFAICGINLLFHRTSHLTALRAADDSYLGYTNERTDATGVIRWRRSIFEG